MPRNYVEPPITSNRLEIAKVYTNKICFRPNERGSGHVTVINGTDQPIAGKLKVSILSGLDSRQLLVEQDISLQASEIKKVPVVWKIGGDESFGRELKAELMDANGNII